MSIKETYDYLRQKAEERGLISQKDLQARWGLSRRAVQRTRKEFGLEPVDFYGVNPLFTEQDVKRVEEARYKKRLATAKKPRGRVPGKAKPKKILTLKEIRARLKRQHGKGLSK